MEKEGKGVIMKIQEAAEMLLKEENAPLTSREIAKRALERGLVTSIAKDPIFSHATTIEKNIREGVYNNPVLIFIHAQAGRLIGLPSWDKIQSPKENKGQDSAMSVKPFGEPTRTFSLKIPADLYEKLELANQARIMDTFEKTVIHILKRGLHDIAPAIKKGLIQQIEQLDENFK